MNPIASNGLGKDWYIFQTIVAKLAKLQTLSIKQWICVYRTVSLLAEQNRAYEMHYSLTGILQSQLPRGLTGVINKVIIHRTREDFRVKSTST